VAGGGRVYVHSGPRFDYLAWLAAYRQGRSFASNGPIAVLTVDGKEPGDEIRLDGPATVRVSATVTAQVPLETVELIVNGKAAHSVPAARKEKVEFSQAVKVDGSSWIALRALGPRHRLVLNDTMAFAHTSPVYVTVAGRPVRIAGDIGFYRDWVERLIARTEKSGRFGNPEQKAEIIALFRKALAWYQAGDSGRR
jgi:hypothetical protein